ncbi:alpha amylase family protein [Anaerobacillus isosaccharinicus]|uniref:Alpha amylase family protein n=1 Tax=Anaerobacillus isosaccharinicus TaxID=1532552 RepID=A0A7S7LA49_9BACI|nr:alpha amylase family protein [Anaerobacillus isosaccharinicus]MBA5584481.1 family 10 glycosylhydrolase [Anaerobacillus isosaccharinicus]QOY37135.1 family 10 glycosylhydrolase [Anaerobacillus isosaccharinicus]
MPKFDKSAKVLWVDFLANGQKLTSAEMRNSYIENAKKAGFTHVVVDAKLPYGYVTYKSEIAPHVGLWERFTDWRGIDYLEIMLDSIKKSGMKSIIKFDVFSEGNIHDQSGFIRDKQEWQVTYYHNDQSTNRPIFTKAENYLEPGIFVNPAHPEVKEYELSIIKEVVSKYSADAIVLDRCRYPNVYGDFSEFSRVAFEVDTGLKVDSWPGDILTLDQDQIVPGRLYKKWIMWRANNIKKFVVNAKSLIKEQNNELDFGIYVGAWYPDFYHEGVNWGSTNYQPEYDWMDGDYAQTGYASELDFLMTGCYFPSVTIDEARRRNKREWESVEGAIELSKKVTTNDVPILAGLYLQEYHQNEINFTQAVNICLEKSDGMMIFDAIHLEMYQWWEHLELNK